MKKLIIKRGISSKNLPINAFIPLTPSERKRLHCLGKILFIKRISNQLLKHLDN